MGMDEVLRFSGGVAGFRYFVKEKRGAEQGWEPLGEIPEENYNMGTEGIEPPPTALEAIILPIYDAPIWNIYKSYIKKLSNIRDSEG